jgi:hypothetical protein
VCPLVAVVADDVELDVDEPDVLVVDVVELGIVAGGGVAVPFWLVWKYATSYCEGARAAL